MTAPALAIVSAGPLSTLQDRGRFGFRRFGVAQAGAFDPLYLAIANALVGNAPDEAAIEFTLKGDRYRVVSGQCLVGIAGDFKLQIDDQPAEPWRSHLLREGQVLSIGTGQRDVRGYVAVAGGFDVAPVLGSRATHVRTGIGGFEGRALKARDQLSIRAAGSLQPRRFDLAQVPLHEAIVRVVPGPQDGHFTPEGLRTFAEAVYTVSPEADRMGYRLSGAEIAHGRDYNLISEGISVGAIQVPGSGQPIVLLNDCQTTGGYPKIGVVIESDLRLFAQMKPGGQVRFEPVARETALRAVADYRRRLELVPDFVHPV